MSKELPLAQPAAPSQTAWLLSGIIVIAATLRAPFTSVGPLVHMIREQTGMTNTMAGMLTTIPLIAFAIISPLVPKAARRIGIEPALFISLLLLTVGILLRYVASMGGLLGGTLLVGVAIAVGNVLLPGLVKREFSSRAGAITGIYSVTMNLSAAIGAGISIPLAVDAGFGWRGALLCWCALSAVALLIWLPQLRSKSSASPGGAAEQARPKSGSLWRSPLAWCVTLLMGCQSLVFYVLSAWLPDMLQTQGMSVAASGWMLSILQLASLPSSFLMPVLAARLPNQKWLGAIVGLLYLAGFAGLTWGPVHLAVLWMVFLGMGAGAAISLVLLLFGLRTKSPQQAAELSGMAQSFGYLLAAAGPILFGLIHDWTGGWGLPLMLLMAVSLLVLLFGVGAGRPGYVLKTGADAAQRKQAS